jgi:molecular chaperone DnaJ
MKDYYAVLGVSPTATPEEIKRARRKLVRKSHPDGNDGNSDKVAKFHDSQEAYEILSDAQKRHAYDESRKKAILEGPLAEAQDIWTQFIHQTIK